MKEKLMKARLMNNIGLKLLAFLIAVLTWLIVVNIDDPITTKVYSNIPVEVINADVVTDHNRTYQILDKTEEVTVTIRARRSVLSKIRLDDVTARADMKELSLGTQVPIDVTLARYSGKVEEVSSKPANLQVAIDEEAKATFPITPTATGSPRDGYSIETLNCDPLQITFSGPQQLITSINRVSALVDVTGLSATETLPGKLIIYDNYENVIDQTMINNNLEADGVSVEVVMNSTKKVPILLDTSMINTQIGYTLNGVKVAPSELKIKGAREVLSKVGSIQIPAEALASNNLHEMAELTIDVTPYLPEQVQLDDANANMVVVSVFVEHPDVKAYQVSMDSLDILNLPEYLQVDVKDLKDLSIQVRGPEKTLNDLTLDGRVKIDMTECGEPGEYDLPVTVVLPDNCELVNDIYVRLTVENTSGDSYE